jgi:hypothetical protein
MIITPGPAQAVFLGVIGTPYGPASVPIVAGPDGQARTYYPAAVSGYWWQDPLRSVRPL